MGRHTATVLKFVVSVIFVATLLAAIVFYSKYQSLAADDPSQEAAQISRQITKAVELPAEAPTMVTVTDPTKIANEALAERSQPGDKLLIYRQAKRAILYRPSTGKVIDMFPFVPDES